MRPMSLPIPIGRKSPVQRFVPSGKALMMDARSPDGATVGLLKADGERFDYRFKRD